jgi:alpha-L-rhamnosidase
MVPEKLRAAVFQNLFENIAYRYNSHISSGFIGTMYILDLLTRSGNADLAYDLASQTTYPSWGYMIENGATTLWELWQLRTGPSMNSHNHPMFGSIGAWFYKALAGINLVDGTVAFERIRIQPQMVRDLWHASASLRTLNGTVSNSWSRTEKSIRLEATIPVNSQAVIVLPKFNLVHICIREGDRPVWAEKKYEAGVPGISTVKETASDIEIHVGSGTYTFVLTGE